MRLNEVFDTKVDIEVVHDYSNEYVSHLVMGPRTIEFRAVMLRKGDWSVEFTEVATKEKDDPLRDRKWAATGGGDELKVFSYVVGELKKVIEKHHPEIIEFSGSNREKGNRAKVYRRMTKRFTDYQTFEIDKGPSIDFKLLKKGDNMGVLKMLAGIKEPQK